MIITFKDSDSDYEYIVLLLYRQWRSDVNASVVLNSLGNLTVGYFIVLIKIILSVHFCQQVIYNTWGS